MKRLINAFCVFLAVLIASNVGLSEIHLSSDVAWQVGVGTWPASLGWGDFDNNGWIDIVTGVGIDVDETPDAIYFNDETGLSTTPGWQSEYEGGSCLLYVGDLDNDGDLDLVVPSDGQLGTNFPQEQVIYYNNDGFPASPDWVSEPLAAWSCVAGDADGDGDLDIVFPDHAYNGPNR
ncbi:MAG: VCBS repeat-containing protein, partial [Candidatus Zixiibacteriota bacterium]